MTQLAYVTEREQLRAAMRAVEALLERDLPHTPHWRFGYLKTPDGKWVICAEGHLALVAGAGALDVWAGVLDDATRHKKVREDQPTALTEDRVWGTLDGVPVTVWRWVDESAPACVDEHGPLAVCRAKWAPEMGGFTPCGCEGCDIDG